MIFKIIKILPFINYEIWVKNSKFDPFHLGTTPIKSV